MGLSLELSSDSFYIRGQKTADFHTGGIVLILLDLHQVLEMTAGIRVDANC